MADKKVSDLPSLNGADVDPADLLYIVDSSAGAAGSKKITVGQYQLAPVSGGTANTVVYLNGSKVESSSSALTFDGTNLGIGTSSPGAKLDVSGSVNAVQARFGNVAGRGLEIGTSIISGTNDAGSVLNAKGATSGTLIFQTDSTERMRLDSSGNLGLGVTPSAWSGSGVKAFDVGTGASFAGSGSDAGMIANAYFNGTNWIYKTSSLAVRYQQLIGTGVHAWYTAPSGTAGNAITFTQAMTLDASSNLTLKGNYIIDDTGTGIVSAQGTGASALTLNGRAAILFTTGGLPTGGTERARITSGGEVVVNETAAVAGAAFSSNAFSGTAAAGFKSNASTVYAIVTIWGNETSGNQIFTRFATDANQERGTIAYNRAGGLVAYNTTSDYRAKDIIGPVQNAGATIDALKVYEGVMKGATQSRPMLIAHEAQEHAPYAVSGVKDEVNEDGTPKLQQMDVSSLVPLLLAEIQSLRARVAALEAK